jgi:PAS domain S-box-containing protein
MVCRSQSSRPEVQDLLRTVFENISDYGIVLLRPDGRISSWSLGAERITGYSEQEAIGRRISFLYTREDTGRGLPQLALATAAAEGRFRSEISRLRKDGSLYQSEVVTVALREDNGRLWGFAEIACDITARVPARGRAPESEARYRNLIENALDIVTIMDADGTIRYESPAIERVLGYKPDELIGRSVFDFIRTSDAQSIHQALRRVVEKRGPPKAVELEFRHKNGSWVILEGLAKNLLDDPAVRGIIVNSRDTTERRRAEAELREKEAALAHSHEQLQSLTGRLLEAEQRERRRLSRELHDDLNQKLAVLSVDVGVLAKALPASDPEKIHRELRAVQARVAKLCGEVRRLAYQLHPSVLDDLGLPVALRSYCAEFSEREQIHTTFAHRNIYSPVPQDVASTIYRITQEGLRNVAKHSGSKRASVSLIGTLHDVTLTIRDFGGGFRPDSGKRRAGLGLTSMKERARLIGGELSIASKPNRGTTVRVRIPWRASTE